MSRITENSQPWAILLAGGEGNRLCALTKQITGFATPKQFCPIVGERCLIDQTRERVAMVVNEERLAIALTRTQEHFYQRILGDTPSSNLVIQPVNRGTAPAILYALLRVAEMAPSARVAMFPCDHYVDDDHTFMRHVEVALDAIVLRPELTVLLGIAAHEPETSYGWIEPGNPVGSGPVFSVRHFWEKPHAELALELLKRGCLWNSFVIVGRVSTLLGLFLIALPGLYASFNQIRGSFGTALEEQTVARLYETLSPSSFSSDVLMRHGVNLGVLPVTGVHWNDLGEPNRVLATLNHLGIQPPWLAA
jgi:mannose-1-phosphate guanylyltransferase